MSFARILLITLLPSLAWGEISSYVVDPYSNDPYLPNSDYSGLEGSVITLRGAPGETVSGSFVLVSDTHECALQLASEINIKVVKTWWQAQYAWNNIGKIPGSFAQKLIPELIVYDDAIVRVVGDENHVRSGAFNYVHVNPFAETSGRLETDIQVSDATSLQPVELNPGEAKQFWFNVTMPSEPTSHSIDPVGITVNLQPRGFPLEDGLTYGVYYRGVLGQDTTVGSEHKDLNQFRAELEHMYGAGINAIGVYQPLATLGDALAEILPTNTLFYLGVNTSSYTSGMLPQLRADVAQAKSVAESFGIDTVYIYGRDEASGSGTQAELPEYEAIQAEGAKVFVAGHNGVFEVAEDKIDLFIDAWHPETVEAGLWHSIGSKIMSYANQQSPIENPFRVRRNYGIVLWAFDYDGAFLYAYQDAAGDIYNDVDHPTYRDHVMGYPTVNGVIDTLQMNGLRAAIYDVRYLKTLEHHIALGIESADEAKRAAARDAETYLEDLREHVISVSTPLPGQKYSQGWDFGFEQMRDEVSSHIGSLQ